MSKSVIKPISGIFRVLLPLFFFTGCGGDSPYVGPETPPSPPPVTPVTPPDPDPYFRIVASDDSDVPASLVFNYHGDGRYYSIKYETNMDTWTATSDADWCRTKVDYPSQGWLHFEVDTYTEDFVELYPRFCHVKIKAPDVLDRTLTVGQECRRTFLYTLPNDRHDYKLAPSGASMDLTVACNLVDWDIQNKTDWIVAEKINRTCLRVKVSPSDSPQPRKGSISLVSIANGASGNENIEWVLNFSETDPGVSGDDYNYGNGVDWD